MAAFALIKFNKWIHAELNEKNMRSEYFLPEKLSNDDLIFRMLIIMY